jgi:hypothetical protein
MRTRENGGPVAGDSWLSDVTELSNDNRLQTAVRRRSPNGLRTLRGAR